MIKLYKEYDGYKWAKGKDASILLSRAHAKAFGVWWLRIERKQVEAGMAMMEETKHNTAFFADDRKDFLFVNTTEVKS